MSWSDHPDSLRSPQAGNPFVRRASAHLGLCRTFFFLPFPHSASEGFLFLPDSGHSILHGFKFKMK